MRPRRSTRRMRHPPRNPTLTSATHPIRTEFPIRIKTRRWNPPLIPSFYLTITHRVDNQHPKRSPSPVRYPYLPGERPKQRAKPPAPSADGPNASHIWRPRHCHPPLRPSALYLGKRPFVRTDCASGALSKIIRKTVYEPATAMRFY